MKKEKRPVKIAPDIFQTAFGKSVGCASANIRGVS